MAHGEVSSSWFNVLRKTPELTIEWLLGLYPYYFIFLVGWGKASILLMCECVSFLIFPREFLSVLSFVEIVFYS